MRGHLQSNHHCCHATYSVVEFINMLIIWSSIEVFHAPRLTYVGWENTLDIQTTLIVWIGVCLWKQTTKYCLNTGITMYYPWTSKTHVHPPLLVLSRWLPSWDVSRLLNCWTNRQSHSHASSLLLWRKYQTILKSHSQLADLNFRDGTTQKYSRLISRWNMWNA